MAVFLDGKKVIEAKGRVLIYTVDGIDYIPGSDVDVDLATVEVTGTPRLWWDEATDSFESNKNVTVCGQLTIKA